MLVIYILCDISEKRSLLPSPRVDPGSSVLSCYSKVVICQCETAPYTLDAVKWQLCLMWSHLDISLMCTEVTGEGSRGQMLHRVWPAWQNFGTDIWYFESPLGKYRHWRPSISRTTTTHLVLKADKRLWKIHAVPKAALWGAMTRKQVLMKFCTSRGPLHLKANLTCFCPKISKPQLTHLKLQYLSSWTNGFRMFLGRRERTGELTVRTLTLFSCLAIVLWTMKLFIASFLQCNRDFAPACFWLVMHSSKAGLSFFYEPTLHFSPGHSRRATKRFLFCFLKSVCSFLLYLLGVSLFVCLFGNLCETPFVKWWCPFFTRISLFGFVLPFRFSYLIIILEWNALWKPVVVGAESTL